MNDQVTKPTYPQLQAKWMELHTSGKGAEAFLVAYRASSLFPAEPLGPLGMCWYHLANSKAQSLLSAAEAAAAQFPDAFDPHFFKCRALELLQASDQLELAYGAAMAAHPGRKLGWVGAARLLADRHLWPAALDLLSRGMDLVLPHELEAFIRDYIAIRSTIPTPPGSAERERLIEATHRAPAASGEVVRWLLETCQPTERGGVLDRLSTEFPENDTLFELQLRSQFDKRDYRLVDETFIHYALRNNATTAFKLLWIERLFGLGELEQLTAYLTAHAETLKTTDVGMNGAIVLIDAITNCIGAGLSPQLTIADVKSGDTRISRTVDAYRSGDPYLHLRESPNTGVVPKYIRVHSFIHQGWSVPIAPFKAQEVSDMVIAALVERRPFSLIRLGDGEGNFLRWQTTTLINATMFRTAEHVLTLPEISRETYEGLHATLLEYLTEASVLGVPNEFMTEIAEDWACVSKALVALPLEGALTDHAIHYALAEYGCFERAIALQLIAKLPVIYIGPHDPATFLNLAVPTESIIHWGIPGEAYYFPETLQEDAHYPHYFNAIMDRITALPDKALVLISAGLLGKLYAGAVRRKGGVALDIGAVSDHWAGHNTRIYAQQAGKVSANRLTLRELLAPH